MEGGAAELWIPDGGRFALTGGVIYTWLSEQGFCAIAAQDPEQAVPVWKQEQALTVRQTVPVTGGIVFWLAENEPDPDAGQLWVVLLRNSGQWELSADELGLREMLSPDGVTKARKAALERLRSRYPGSGLHLWRDVYHALKDI